MLQLLSERTAAVLLPIREEGSFDAVRMRRSLVDAAATKTEQPIRSLLYLISLPFQAESSSILPTN